MHFCCCHINTNKRDIAAKYKFVLLSTQRGDDGKKRDEKYYSNCNFNIRQKHHATLQLEWRFNENSFVKLLLKQFHSIFARICFSSEKLGKFFPFFSKMAVEVETWKEAMNFIHDQSIIVWGEIWNNIMWLQKRRKNMNVRKSRVEQLQKFKQVNSFDWFNKS